MANYRIAVFASGEGTNFQSLVDAVRNGGWMRHVDLLVCDKPSGTCCAAGTVTQAMECHLFTPKNYASREAYRVRDRGSA